MSNKKGSAETYFRPSPAMVSLEQLMPWGPRRGSPMVQVKSVRRSWDERCRAAVFTLRRSTTR